MTRAQSLPDAPPLPLVGRRGVRTFVDLGAWARLTATFTLHFTFWLAIWALLPSLFGWRPVVLLSGSMAPIMRQGDVMVYEASDGRSLGPGTVVLFQRADERRATVHRIASVLPDGSYVTSGDANPAQDSSPVAPGDVRGIGRLLVPLIGLPYHWWNSGEGLPLVIAVGVLVLALALGTGGRSAPTMHRGRWSPRLRQVAALGVAALLIAGGCRLATAAYSATTTNTGNSWAAAATFCTPGSQTVTSSADSEVNQDKPTENFGSLTEMSVEAKPGQNLRSLVRFTLPSIPAGCNVTAATLSLWTRSLNAGLTYQAWRAAADWAETTVSWNNQPGTTGTAATSTTATGWVSWTVTAQVQQMYAGTNNGFLIRDAAEGGTTGMNKYSTREDSASWQPSLVISWG